MIGRNYALQHGFTGVGVVVGVMDQAARTTHSEYADRWLGGYSVDDMAYGPPLNHGTHVSGTIGGVNVGVAPGTLLYGIDWFALNGDVGVSKGFNWGSAQGIRLFNNSWEFKFADPVSGISRTVTLTDLSKAQVEAGIPQALASLRDGLRLGTLQVFATGNSGLAQPSFVAGLPYYFPELQGNWLAVTALGPTRTLASYANQCGLAANWCLSAPGGDGVGNDSIWSASAGGDNLYFPENGTSMAAPHVTGAVAIAAEIFPQASNAHLAQLVLQTATDIGQQGIDPVYGWGLLNLRNLVDTINPATATVFTGATQARFGALSQVTQLLGTRAAATDLGAISAAGVAPLAYSPVTTASLAITDAMTAPAGRNAWLSPVLGMERAATHGSRTIGIIGGIDLLQSQNLRLGVAAGFTAASTFATGTDNSATANNLHFGLYGHWAANGWFVDGTGQVARFDQTVTRRTISGATGTSLAPVGVSSFSGFGLEASVRAGHRFEIPGFAAASPYASVIGRGQQLTGASETGAGAFGLDLPSSAYAQMEIGVGLRLETEPVAFDDHELNLALDLSYARLTGDRDLNTSAALHGRAITTTNGHMGEDVLRIGAQLNLNATTQTGVNWFGRYDAQFQNQSASQSLAIGGHFRF
ncbi:S8 family peptidase [Devosia limi]|nr:S8 family serine peptidase [Devosia limi]